MKKIALIATLLVITGGMGFAQSLELYETVGGQDVRRQNGELLTKNVDTKEAFTFGMKVKNVNTGSLNVYCKKVYLLILQGSNNSFCWDVCYVPKVMVSTNPILMKSQEVVNRFDGTYDSYGYSGESRIRYVWFDGANPNDSVCVETKYLSRPMGVDEPTLTSGEMFASPNPAGNYVKLSWKPSGLPGKLILHDLLGNKILEIVMEDSAKEITLNTTDYPDGLYFCIFESEGQARVAKKLIIRH